MVRHVPMTLFQRAPFNRDCGSTVRWIRFGRATIVIDDTVMIPSFPSIFHGGLSIRDDGNKAIVTLGDGYDVFPT